VAAVTIDFDPAELREGDPYPRLRQVRDIAPVGRLPSGFWIVTGYDAALEMLRHPHATSGPIALRYLASLPPGAARDEMSHRINFLDPPDHPRVRALVSRAFSPRRVGELRPFIERTSARLLDELDPAQEVDLLERFAHQVPSLVISEMLGVPTADRADLTAWSDAVSPLLGFQLESREVEAALAAAEEMAAYMARLLDERLRAPGEDLLSALAHAEEDGHRLSRAEVLSLAATLYSAGHRTTRDLFCNGVSVLLRDPAALAWVRADRSRVPAAVQEFLRYETPTLFVARFPSREITLGGAAIGANEPVLLVLAAANRDPAVFAEPDRFDPARFSGVSAGVGPLSFAFGPHFCLGASLARLEAEVMLAALLARWPEVALADAGRLAWRQRGPFRGLAALPVRLRKSAR
jgi:cytochrome P450